MSMTAARWVGIVAIATTTSPPIASSWIVLDDGSLDTGNINPGASSAPLTLTGSGGSYHCAIHPTMVGTIGPGCTFALSPASASAPSTASNASVSVTAAAACAWTAVSNSAFITITSGASGSSNGVVTYAVAANTGVARSGSMTIAGQVFTVTQAAAPPPCSRCLHRSCPARRSACPSR